MATKLAREGIQKILTEHQAYTKIVYTDTDDRVSYDCDCGATEGDNGLLGVEWLAAHRTEEIAKMIDSLGVSV